MREVLGAGGGVMVPLVLLGVVFPILDRFVPEGPDIQVPKIPLPDLPSIPFPDLPDWVGDVVKLLVAVAVAWSLARGEVRRRRQRADAARPGHPSHPRTAQDETRTPAD